jgi:hypothetical protein
MDGNSSYLFVAIFDFASDALSLRRAFSIFFTQISTSSGNMLQALGQRRYITIYTKKLKDELHLNE